MRLCGAVAVFCVFAVSSIAQGQVPTFRTDHYSAADSIHAVTVELNEDGALDFVFGVGQIQLSNGNGTYRAGGTIPGSNGYVMASGDFDKDSNADVVLADQSSFQIAYGNGTGGFRTITTYAGIAGTLIEKVVAADFNRDGRLDLAFLVLDGFGTGPQKIFTLINTGGGFTVKGPFATETSFHNPTDGNDYTWNPGDLVIGDFDADGKADVGYSVNWIASHMGPGPNHIRLVALFGDGAGNLGAARTVLDSDAVTKVASADMNQDGRSDLVGWNGTCNSTTCGGYVVFYGSSTRTFTTRRHFDGNAGYDTPVIADFNGDHRPDIAMIATDEGNETFGLRIGTQNADGSFTTQPYYSLGFYHSQSGTFPARYLLTGDFDHNRKPDLMTVSDTDQSELLLINTTAKVSANQFPSCTQYGGRGIHLCAPLSGATVGSPVTFRVAASDYKPVRKIELWLNGQKKFETFYSYSNYSYADKALSLPAGTYNATLFSAGYDNSLQKKSFTFTVH